MSDRTDLDFVSDILNSIEKIESYCLGINYSKFLEDTKTQDAVIRNIGIIGEAASRVSEEFRTTNDNIPWQKIKGTRNRLVHDYSGTNLDVLWNINKEDLPDLYLKFKKLAS